MTTTEATMFKTFSSWSEFDKKTVGYKIYVRLSCNRFVHVDKNALKEIAASMQNNDEKFFGEITYSSGGRKYVQVTIASSNNF